MENSKEKKGKSSDRRQMGSPDQDDGSEGEQQRQLRRKIRKKQRRSSKRQVVAGQHTPYPRLQQLLSPSSPYAGSPPPLLYALQQAQLSRVPVRQILARQTPLPTPLPQPAHHYLHLLRQTQNVPPFSFVLNKSSKPGLILHCVGEAGSMELISSEEMRLLGEREELRESIWAFVERENQRKRLGKFQIPALELQLLTLCKFTSTLERDISNRLQGVALRQDFIVEEEKSALDDYVRILALKNLQSAFSEAPIDFLNYHRMLERYENNNWQQPNSSDSIQSLEDFRKYIDAKKPHAHKSSAYLLRTPCAGCLGDRSEQANPILNCPECHLRMHLHCQSAPGRCHRCKYARTSNAEKQLTDYCYLCCRPRQKGLLIQTVTATAPHRYAHVFCLLIHALWQPEQQQVMGRYVECPQREKQCAFCLEKTGKSMNCRDCSTQMHGMCAYIAGCSFTLDKEQKSASNYEITVSCCQSEELKERLSMQRQFKLNLQKVIFRGDERLFSYITRILTT